MGMSKWWMCCVVLALIGCAPEPALVASNCDDPTACAGGQALKLDAVDILLVVDDSASITNSVQALKQQLPRLLNAITSGDGEGMSFPPAQSVHVAVTTSDMGIGERKQTVAWCDATGQDGLFIKPGERVLSCDVTHPSYLAFDGGPAAVATVETVSCVPLVGPVMDPDGEFLDVGCGFEQPLEAALKSLWPKDESSIHFVQGFGHGDAENAGFLRPDSLLVVVVVTDEDDCSPSDLELFDRALNPQLDNLACSRHSELLQPPSRYIEGLRALRPGNKNLIFGLIGGVPAELVSPEYRARFDLEKDSGTAEYYDAILADERMQEVEDPAAADLPGQLKYLRPSCRRTIDGKLSVTTPPRRLLEVAKGFGTRSVVGSLCTDDFGVTTGQLIRAIGEQLANPVAK